MMLAVIETGGKQYLVSEGKGVKIERIKGEAGEKIKFDRILLFFDGKKTAIGTPYLKGLVVEGEVIKSGRLKKVIVFRYHSKTRYRKKKGHRQHFSEVLIKRISL